MKTALSIDGRPLRASLRAPLRAICPCCGEPVELRYQKNRWYWRHVGGAGARCSRRAKPPRGDEPTQLDGDPYELLGMELAERTVRQARRGNVQAALALAFSPVIAMALDRVGVAPEEVLAIVVEAKRPCGQPDILVTEDAALVQREAARQPGPIFDLRPHNTPNTPGSSQIEASPWYVSLYPVGPATVVLVRQILGLAKKVYVLGGSQEWNKIVGE